MNAQSNIRTAEDADRLKMALLGPDLAFWTSEQKWGVGRLERLISQPTLASFKRGWDSYRQALDEGDAPAVEAIGSKMCLALRVMDAEATAAGHKPLAPDTWEAAMPDGRVLVVCRTEAEATAIQRAANGRRFTAGHDGGMAIEAASTETTLPVDLAVTIREQHEGRRLEVWTLAAIVRLVLKLGTLVPAEAPESIAWEGSLAHSGVRLPEMAAADIVKSGYPLDKPVMVALDF